MSPKPFAIPSAFLAVFAFSLLLSSPAVSAHNITRILENYPEFKGFSDLLNQTNLDEMINHRSTITVLAVRDVSGAASHSLDMAKNIMSTHIVLDYFDAYKLQKETKRSVVMTTLFQSSGMAMGVQGFLNMTKANGQINFGSAIKGSPIDSRLLRLVEAHPYNISILEISHLIMVPGLDGNFTSPPPPPAPASPPPPAVAESPEAEGPVSADSPAEAPAADAPAPSGAPARSPTPSSAPADDETPDAETPPPPSSSSRIVFGSFGVVIVGMVTALIAL